MTPAQTFSASKRESITKSQSPFPHLPTEIMALAHFLIAKISLKMKLKTKHIKQLPQREVSSIFALPFLVKCSVLMSALVTQDCSLQNSSVLGILQAESLDWCSLSLFQVINPSPGIKSLKLSCRPTVNSSVLSYQEAPQHC